MATVWNDLAQLALEEARVDTSVHWLTVQQLLTWLSEAQHEYQIATNRVKRFHDITLDPNSADGSYPWPADFKDSVDARYYSGANTGDPQTVDRVPYDIYLARRHQTTNDLTASGVLTPPQQGAILTLAHTEGYFWVWPYKGATGTVRVRYMPHLVPYTASDTVNWPGYGADPQAKMLTEGPATEFAEGFLGIKDYCLARILKKKPTRSKIDLLDAADAVASFERATENLRRKNVDYANLLQTPFYLGPTF